MFFAFQNGLIGICRCQKDCPKDCLWNIGVRERKNGCVNTCVCDYIVANHLLKIFKQIKIMKSYCI